MVGIWKGFNVCTFVTHIAHGWAYFEEENFKEMEEEVHRLLETSADGKVKKNFNDALIKAKEAAAKEKKIRQLREQNNSLD